MSEERQVEERQEPKQRVFNLLGLRPTGRKEGEAAGSSCPKHPPRRPVALYLALQRQADQLAPGRLRA